MNDQNVISMIQCDIHQDNVTALGKIEQKINQWESVGIKAKYAEIMAYKVSYLIDCLHYDDLNQNCHSCHALAHVHQRTAELIIKARSLS